MFQMAAGSQNDSTWHTFCLAVTCLHKLLLLGGLAPRLVAREERQLYIVVCCIYECHQEWYKLTLHIHS